MTPHDRMTAAYHALLEDIGEGARCGFLTKDEARRLREAALVARDRIRQVLPRDQVRPMAPGVVP
jgi:hypothetical protein